LAKNENGQTLLKKKGREGNGGKAPPRGGAILHVGGDSVQTRGGGLAFFT